jgi:hypothetical protein
VSSKRPLASLASLVFLIATAALASIALAGAPPTTTHAPHAAASAPPATGLAIVPLVDATPAPPDDSRFDTDSSLPVHADDVVDYALRASLDPIKHTVHGEGTITWRNTSSVPARELWVHLYMNAFKNQRSFWLRESIVGFRGTGAVKDWGTIDVRKFALREEGGITTDLWASAELHRPGDDDETDVRVPLPHDIAPGEKIQIDVVWDDKLPAVVERTGYAGKFHMVG